MADDIARGLAKSIADNAKVSVFEGVVKIQIDVNQVAADIHTAMDDHIKSRLQCFPIEKE